MAEHSTWSASGSHRFLTCFGALAMDEYFGVPTQQNIEGSAAFNGTLGHELAAMCLEDGALNPVDCNGVEFEGTFYELSDEMLQAVQDYVDYVRGLPSESVLIESRVYYGDALGVPDDEAFGTADFISYDKSTETLYVADLKTGRHRVDSKANTQILLYAFGARELLAEKALTVRRIVMTIVQPFISATPSAWELSLDEFETEIFKMSLAVSTGEEAIRHANTIGIDDTFSKRYLVPSENGCRYCPHKAHCPAMQEMADAAIVDAASDSEFKNLDEDAQKLGTKLASLPILKLYIDGVESAAMASLMAGKEVSGFKLVQGRKGNSKWTGETQDAILSDLTSVGLSEETLFKPAEIKTPAQLVRDVKKIKELTKADRDNMIIQIETFTQRSEGKLSIVPESSSKEAWSASASDDEFENLT